MMFYSNLVKGNLKFKNFDFTPFNKHMNAKIDEKLLSLGRCKNIYNFNTSTGALVDGMGIGDIELICESMYDIEYKILNLPPNTFISGCYFLKFWEQDKNRYLNILLLYGANRKMYYNVINDFNTDWFKIDNLNFTECPMALYVKIDGVDSLIFYSKSDGMYVWNFGLESAYKVDNPPLITSMCIHDDRLFATIEGEARSIIFSEELNPLNFNVSIDEGGYIKLSDENGKCNKVISFDGNLYVFRDYNIAKVAESKDRKDFIITQIYAGNGKIYPDTITVCGDRVMFLATDGIYEFNGTSAKKIDLEFDNMIVGVDNHYSIGNYFNGEYYLACVMDFKDDYIFTSEENAAAKNNAIIKINVNTYKCEIHRGCDVRSFTQINDGVNNALFVVYAYESNSTYVGLLKDVGMVKSLNIRKSWISEMYDFGIPNKVKFIKEITFISKSDIYLDVYIDDKIKTIRIIGKNSAQTIKINEKAKRVGFGFRSDNSNNYISIPQLRVGFYE